MEALTPRAVEIRDKIAEFFANRDAAKQKKLPENSPEPLVASERASITDSLAKAIKNLRSQKKNPLRLATHPAKATHSSSDGSSLFVLPSTLPPRADVGSHCLPDSEVDAVGNAAVQGIYKFLMLDFAGESLLSLLQKKDPDLLAAFGVDAELAEEWRIEFCKVLTQDTVLRSDRLAKQVYWLVTPPGKRPNVHEDGHFNILIPYFSSPSAQKVFETIEQDRAAFFEQVKEKKKDQVEAKPYYTYPDLAVEIKGGSNTQNVSVLNAKRRGKNYLLASLPPQWDNSATRPLYGVDSLFVRFGSLPQVRRLLRELRDYLGKQKPEASNMYIRNRRDAWLEDIFTELLQFGAAFSNGLPKGWTANSDCRLPLDEQCWLDPYRAEDDEAFNKVFQWQDWPYQLAERFARWLNGSLGAERLSRHQLSLNEAEFDYWRRELVHNLAWQRDLDCKRRDLDNRLLPAANKGEAPHGPA